MRTFTEARIRSAMRRGCILVSAWIASACGTAGGARPPAVEVHEAAGFTITERARFSAEVRADFESALRLLEQERYADGIELLQKVVESAPGATTAHIDLAIALGRVGDLQRAEASLERALELNPRHPVAHNELGIIQRRTGRFAEARESYEKALALHPGFHFARRNLAILCDVYLADPTCALEHYELYTRAVPDDEAAAMWVADLRNRVGR
jgi:tetratricopeptide (TPR) repeat protein